MSAILGALFAVLIGMMAVRPFVTYETAAAGNVRNAATAQEMQQIDSAAQQYIEANYATVEANATATAPATISVGMLETSGYLSSGVSSENPWGQTWFVQVLQPSPGTLEALVLTSGGSAIPEKEAPAIAALAGQQGGFIPYSGQYGSLQSTIAQGSFGGWSVSMSGFSNPGAGHLAGLLAFNKGNLENDYLYRVAVPGAPQLNTMQTALNMGGNDIDNANNIQANANVGVAGKSATSGLPSNWNGIHTTSAYADGGDFGAGVGGSVLAYMDGANGSQGVVATQAPDQAFQAASVADDSEAYFNVTNTGGGFARMVVPDSTNNDAYVATNGNFTLLNPNGNSVAWDALNYGLSYSSYGVQLGDAGGSAIAGNGCPTNGVIASSANGTGELMACVSGEWEPATSGFNNSYQTGVAAGAWYKNTSGLPMFLASYCALTGLGYGYPENVTIYVINSAAQIVSYSQGQVSEGGSDAQFNAAPSTSAMVPAGDWYSVNGHDMSCSLMVTD